MEKNIEQLNGKRILITGASGLIGGYLINMLLEANKQLQPGIFIYALGRSKKRLEDKFATQKSEKLCLIEQDVTQPISFDFAIDYVIHAAGNSYPASFRKDPVGTIMVNVQGTYQLLEYARAHGAKRLLFLSSGEVYGQGRKQAYQESDSEYVDPTQARSCYPGGKRAAETLCVSYTKQYGLDTVIARPCHTFGPDTGAEDNRANVQFVKQVLKDEDIVLKSAGNQLRSYCYIADCATAILTILLKGKSCEAYNISCPGEQVTIAEFAKMVADCSGKMVMFENPDAVAQAEQTPIGRQVLDSSKLQALGWKNRFSIQEGIRQTLAALQAKEREEK